MAYPKFKFIDTHDHNVSNISDSSLEKLKVNQIKYELLYQNIRAKYTKKCDLLRTLKTFYENNNDAKPGPHISKLINIPLYRYKVEKYTYLELLSMEHFLLLRIGASLNCDNTILTFDKLVPHVATALVSIGHLIGSDLELIKHPNYAKYANMKSKDIQNILEERHISWYPTSTCLRILSLTYYDYSNDTNWPINGTYTAKHIFLLKRDELLLLLDDNDVSYESRNLSRDALRLIWVQHLQNNNNIHSVEALLLMDPHLRYLSQVFWEDLRDMTMMNDIKVGTDKFDMMFFVSRYYTPRKLKNALARIIKEPYKSNSIYSKLPHDIRAMHMYYRNIVPTGSGLKQLYEADIDDPQYIEDIKHGKISDVSRIDEILLAIPFIDSNFPTSIFIGESSENIWKLVKIYSLLPKLSKPPNDSRKVLEYDSDDQSNHTLEELYQLAQEGYDITNIIPKEYDNSIFRLLSLYPPVVDFNKWSTLHDISDSCLDIILKNKGMSGQTINLLNKDGKIFVLTRGYMVKDLINNV